MYIYKITNKINSKCYIGQTTRSVKVRWLEHTKYHLTARSHCRKLANALRKYGIDEFIVEVIDTAISVEELNDKEVYWVQFYDSINNGYNLVVGGDNKLISDETRQKLSESGKGRVQSLETREKIASAQRGNKNHNFGKKASRETKLKWSKARKGRPKSEEHKRKIGIGNSKKIICHENNKTYNSITEACKDLGIKRGSYISRVLSKERTHTHGFTFSFLYT